MFHVTNMSLQCLESHHQKLQQLNNDYCIIGKTRSVTLILWPGVQQWLWSALLPVTSPYKCQKVLEQGHNPASPKPCFKVISTPEHKPVKRPTVLVGIPRSCRGAHRASQCNESMAFFIEIVYWKHSLLKYIGVRMFPVLVYGCKTRTLKSNLKRQLDTFGNRCLCRIMGYN